MVRTLACTISVLWSLLSASYMSTCHSRCQQLQQALHPKQKGNHSHNASIDTEASLATCCCSQTTVVVAADSCSNRSSTESWRSIERIHEKHLSIKKRRIWRPRWKLKQRKQHLIIWWVGASSSGDCWLFKTKADSVHCLNEADSYSKHWDECSPCKSGQIHDISIR